MDYAKLHADYLNSGAMAKLILESTYDALFTQTPDGIITSWNKGAEKIYGYSESEIVGQNTDRLIPSDKSDEYRKLIAKLKSGEKIEGLETSRVSKFGTVIDVIYSAIPINEGGLVIGFAVFHRDITLLKKTERDFFDLCEQASDGIFIANLDGQYTYVNTAACKMLGYSREELIGKSIADLIPPEDKNRLQESKVLLMHAGEIQIEEWLFKTRNGTFIPTEVSAKILADGRWQALVRDLSAIKKAGKKFTHIFEFAPDAQLLVDSDGVIQLVNEQCEKTFGYSRTELIGQKIETLVPDRYKSGHVVKREDFVKEAEGKEFVGEHMSRRTGAGRQLFGRKKDGSEFEADILISAFNLDGERILLAVVRDLTEIRRSADYARNIGDSSDNLKYYH